MRPAPAVHAEDVDPVLAIVDQRPKRPLHLRQIRVRQKALVHRLLAACGPALEEVVYLRKPAVIADVVGYEIETPAHGLKIPFPRPFVMNDNLVNRLGEKSGVSSQESEIKREYSVVKEQAP